MNKSKNLITTVRNLIIISTLWILVAIVITVFIVGSLLGILSYKTDLHYLIASSVIMVYAYCIMTGAKRLINKWNRELEAWL